MSVLTCKNVFTAIGLLSLCFIGIPFNIVSDDAPIEKLFLQFVQQHNKTYRQDPSEYQRRFNFFKLSYKRSTEHNLLHGQSKCNASFGITKFSDMGAEEFQEVLLRHRPSPPSCVHQTSPKSLKPKKKRSIFTHQQPLPDYIDWREKNIISSVKNQYSCGACWAFSTVETVESMYALKTGTLKVLSTQQVIDCDTGNKGCVGGDTCTALNWMASSNVSLLEDWQYPLTFATQKCKSYLEGIPGIQVASNHTCYNLAGNEDQLKRILAFHGPVAAAVDAVTWQDYLGGIVQFHCQDSRINHAVQIVGYDARGPIPYYIVRNSWGVDFGIEGYIHIAIGSNLCGIAREVSALNVLL